jgi:capsular polysaccharide biosynthesis protein
VKVPVGAPKLRDYVHMAANGWIVILCAAVLSAGVGWLTWRTETPDYQSSTKVLITTPGSATAMDAFYGQGNSISRGLTYMLLAKSAAVTNPTIEQLGLSSTTDDLAAQITVLPTGSAVFDITVTGTDPEQTRQIADAVTGNLIGVSQQMAKVDTSATDLVQVDKATPAHRLGSMWQSIVQAIAVGVFLAIVLVIAVALVQDRLLGQRQVGRISDEEVAESTR